MPFGEKIEFIDYWGEPFELDASLRVTVKGRGEGYLDDNAHTHRGRFGVWYPQLGDGLATSLSEIESMTDEARAWLSGFLAGNEPPIYEYLGIDGDQDYTEAEWRQWLAFCERFRETGECAILGRRPTKRLEISDDERAEIRVDSWLPWALAGERVWVPDGDSWVEADPQPELVNGAFLVGTACAERRHCSLLGLDSGWNVCMDCGECSDPPD